MRSSSKKKNILCLLVSLLLVSSFCMTASATSLDVKRTGQTPSGLTANGFEVEDISDDLAVKPSAKYVLSREGEWRELGADDRIWVIVETGETGLLDMSKSVGAGSVLEYLSTRSGSQAERSLITDQDKVKKRLSEKFDITYKHSYTTLLNGFAAEIRYGDLDGLRKVRGVKNVIVSEQYNAPQQVEATENLVNVYDTGIYNSTGIGYTGLGTVAAVLDTGLDYTHTAFQDQPSKLALNKDRVAGIIDQTTARSFTENLSADDVYVSDKIPFAYDYADKDADVYPREDHGTHVAGIIAGKDDEITGVAVDAQLAIMKVFSNYDEGANTMDILAALSDAVLLQVDVINMSLGTACGFSDSADDEATDEIYNKIRNAGISLIAAASNDYSAAKGSDYGDTSALTNPDSGTVGSPASLEAAMAVASISGVKTEYAVANGETPVYISKASDARGKDIEFVKLMLGDSSSRDVEYVSVPGVGRSGNYTGIDVAGKIALVQRGIISFQEKVGVATALGAIGVIIYNNMSGSIRMSVGTSTQIPTCSIGMDTGKLLAAKPSGTLHFDKTYLAGPFMSDFSSWGVLPDLELKPEITAHGGEIYSAVPGGYDRISGTSMAAPNMAGATTLVRQYVKEKYPELSNIQVTDLVYQLMMSTATPALNEDGNPYSPRKQGAGLAAIYEATHTNAYLYVEDSNKSKLSLGDDAEKTGEYVLKFKLKNISAESMAYRLESDIMTETVSSDEKTIAEKSYMLTDSKVQVSVTGNGSYSGGYVFVKGYSEADICVTIRLSEAAKDYLDRNFTNGMFVEGFARLVSDNADGINLSIPWVAFYGDWTRAPLFDYTAYEITENYEDTDVLEEDRVKSSSYESIPIGTYRLLSGYDSNGDPVYQDGSWGLGDYGYIIDEEKKPRPQEDKSSISLANNSTYKVSGLWLGTLRGAKSVDYEVVNAFTGEVIASGTQKNVRKSYLNNGNRAPGFVLFDIDAKEMGLKDNTKYIINATGYLDWEGEQHNLKNAYSSFFYIDSEAPQLDREKLELRIEEKADKSKKYYLDMYVYDNHYIQCMKISTFESISLSGELVGETEFHDSLLPVTGGRNITNKITYDITDYFDLIMRNGEKIYLEFIDYAKNSSSYQIKLPHADANQVGFEEGNTSAKIKINQYLDLKQYLDCSTIKDYDDKKFSVWTDSLKWSSSDESVAIVHDGEVCGLKAGNSTITVTNPTGTSSADFQIEVSTQYYNQEITLRSIEMSEPVLSLEQGESHYLTFEADPWNFDDSGLTYTWSSTNEYLLKVEPDPDNPKRAKITALDSAADMAQEASVIVSAGPLISGECKVTIKNLYKIEGSYIRNYYGRGDENGVLEVPEDLGIRGVYAGAFFNNAYVKKLILPEGVEFLNESCFYGMSSLEEVVLPSTVKELPKWAFGWCTSLKKINLENVQKIGQLSFYQCDLRDLYIPKVVYIAPNAFTSNVNLTRLDLTKVSYIGDSAFSYCSSLASVEFAENVRIGESAFASCNNLTSLILPNSYIGKSAFQSCKNLKSVVLTGENVVIGEQAFAANTALTNLTFSGSVYEIEKLAFYGCTALKEVTLPNGLERLGDGAFSSCSQLAGVSISAGTKLKRIGQSVFEACNMLSAFTADENNHYLRTNDGILYDKSMETLVLVPAGKNLGAFQVPASVHVIGRYAFSISSVTSVTLPNVTVLEEGAFFGSTSLISVNAPKLVTIGDKAFYSCNRLKELPIPATVEYIGAYAFAAATDGKNLVDLELPAQLKSLGEYAFAKVGVLRSVSIPESIKEIPNRCFSECTALVTVRFSDGLERIGDYAFSSSALSALVMPDTVTSMGDGAFFNCIGLKSVTLSESLTAIANGGFQSCTLLSELSLPASVKSIGDSAFYNCTRLNSIDIPGVESITSGAFINTALSEVVAPQLKELGSYVFAAADTNNTLLHSFTAPKLEMLYTGAFINCRQLAEISIPNVNHISIYAFANCTALKTIDISTAKVVGAYAFYGASSLTEVAMRDATFIGSAFLADTSVAFIELPACISNIEEGAFLWANELTGITVAQGDCDYYAVDDVLYHHMDAGSELVAYLNMTEGETFVIPEGVVRIAGFAFNSNKNLKEVTLPRTLKYVGISAFEQCDNLTRYRFLSPAAPMLESVYADGSDQNYRNFTGLIGTVNLEIYRPENGQGYDSYVYSRLFATEQLTDEVLEDATVEAIAAIDAIPDNLTEQDREKVLQARLAYDSVTRVQRDKVENYSKLQAAESYFRVLDAVALITALPNPVTLEDEAEIIAARAAYDALTQSEKAKISNYDTLTAAEQQLAALKKTPADNNGQTGGCGSILPVDGRGGGMGTAMVIFTTALCLAVVLTLKKRKASK